jgi:hypothetical protein
MSDDNKPVGLLGTIHIPIKVQRDPNAKEEEFSCQITAPGPMAKVEELEKALVRNRELLAESQKDMIANLEKDYFDRAPPWLLDYNSPIQNALTARFNINVLIPLINMKGGTAKFTKIESMPVKKHIEKLMVKAEKAALGFQDMRMTPVIYAKRALFIAFFVLAFVFFYIAVTG